MFVISVWSWSLLGPVLYLPHPHLTLYLFYHLITHQAIGWFILNSQQQLRKTQVCYWNFGFHQIAITLTPLTPLISFLHHLFLLPVGSDPSADMYHSTPQLLSHLAVWCGFINSVIGFCLTIMFPFLFLLCLPFTKQSTFSIQQFDSELPCAKLSAAVCLHLMPIFKNTAEGCKRASCAAAAARKHKQPVASIMISSLTERTREANSHLGLTIGHLLLFQWHFNAG